MCIWVCQTLFKSTESSNTHKCNEIHFNGKKVEKYRMNYHQIKKRQTKPTKVINSETCHMNNNFLMFTGDSQRTNWVPPKKHFHFQTHQFHFFIYILCIEIRRNLALLWSRKRSVKFILSGFKTIFLFA